MSAAQRPGGFLQLALACLVLSIASPALAQDDLEAWQQAEEARQEAFRTGMAEIVADLNKGSYERFVNAIDQADMLDRIFGLRLIDQKIKRQFRDNFDQTIEGLVRTSIPAMTEGVRAVLLRVDSREDRGLAVVRLDLPGLQFDYHQYDLRLGSRNRMIIDDWIAYRSGERFTQGIGEMLVRSAPSAAAVRKLVDFRSISEAQLFQLTELLKAARDRKEERYFEIREQLDAELRRQRTVVALSVQLSMAIRKKRRLREALIDVDKYFPDEPLYSLMLLDYYFPTRQYQKAYDALKRLEQQLGVEEAATQARLSATTLVMEQPGEALRFAERAVELDPAVELGWWSLLRVTAVQGDFGRAVEALNRLEGDFGHDLGPDTLGRDPAFKPLVGSAEFEDWLASR